jgi:hypothetical protein
MDTAMRDYDSIGSQFLDIDDDLIATDSVDWPVECKSFLVSPCKHQRS